jgi:hypothetical protein
MRGTIRFADTARVIGGHYLELSRPSSDTAFISILSYVVEELLPILCPFWEADGLELAYVMHPKWIFCGFGS